MKTTKKQFLIAFFVIVIVSGWTDLKAYAENLSSKEGLFAVAVDVPVGIALDNQETLFVVESNQKRVAVINNNRERLADIIGFIQPVSIAVDGATGTLYVGDVGQGIVLVYGADLAFRGQLGVGKGEFIRPVGISVDESGNVFVADSVRNRVRVYGSDRVFKYEFGQTGSTAGLIRHPVAIAVDKGTNEILVVDRPIILSGSGDFEGSRVQVFDPTGKYLRGFGQFGTAEGGLIKTTGVASDHNGRIYVCEADQNVVLTFNRVGTYLETIYDQNALMSTPVGVAVGGLSDRLFVSSISGNRVNVYGSTSQHAVLAESSPGGAITPSGRIAVGHGESVQFTVVPEPGYHVEAVLVDGVDYGVREEFRLPVVVADHTVIVRFSPDFYNLQIDTSAGGSVTPSGTLAVQHNSTLTLAVRADQGWRIADVIVDGTSLGALESYTFSQLTEDHKVLAQFSRIMHTITATAGPGGAVTPAGLLNNPEGSSTLSVSFAQTNVPPVALAGPDQQVLSGRVVLNGEHSFDSDGVIVSWLWEQLDGPSVILMDPGTAKASFIATEFDDYGESLLFRLTVIDNKGASSVDECLITLTDDNLPPVALAGLDQTVRPGETVVLDAGKSLDVDGVISAWSWQQISGPPVALTSPGQAMATFVAPAIDATLIFGLLVTDDIGLRAKDDCLINITAASEPPVAAAGPDLITYEGETVYLNGGNSAYPDDGICSYLWKQVFGTPPVTLEHHTSAQATFIAPQRGENDTVLLTFELLVVDHQTGLADTDRMTVSVHKANTGRDRGDSACRTAKDKELHVVIELPDNLPLDLIETDTIAVTMVNGISVDPPFFWSGSLEIGDRNRNRVPDLRVQFDHNGRLGDLLGHGVSVITVSGDLTDGSEFRQEFRIVLD